MIIFSVRKFFCLSFFDGKGKIWYFIQIFWMEEVHYLNLRDFSSKQIHTTDYTILKTLADFRFKLWQKRICIFWPITTGSKRVEQENVWAMYLCVCWGAGGGGHWEIGGKWNKMAWKIIDSSLRFSTLSTTSLTAPWPKCKEDRCPLKDDIVSASEITPSILPSQDMDMDSKGFKNCIVCVGWYIYSYIEYITSYIL